MILDVSEAREGQRIFHDDLERVPGRSGVISSSDFSARGHGRAAGRVNSSVRSEDVRRGYSHYAGGRDFVCDFRLALSNTRGEVAAVSVLNRGIEL